MSNPHPLSSPTLWLAAGMGLVVGLVCLLLEAGEPFGRWLSAGYLANGFPEMKILPPASPVALLAMVIFTCGAVFAIEGTPGFGRRLLLLLSGLIIFAMASPVLALWGVFWNPFVLLVVVFWSGMVAMLHAYQSDDYEVSADSDAGQNVVRMNPPVSPKERRRRR